MSNVGQEKTVQGENYWDRCVMPRITPYEGSTLSVAYKCFELACRITRSFQRKNILSDSSEYVRVLV
jgi:hypothetical protein